MRRRTAAPEFPESFLPRRVQRAADEAMAEVLAEDFALRTYGIKPAPAGRSYRLPR